MSKEIKSRLLIGNRLLGSLLYFKDAEGRGCLKLQFKNKLGELVKYSATPTTMPALLKSDQSESLDISYKFPDSLMEIKRVSATGTQREFHKVEFPVSTCLFVLRVKDYTVLNEVEVDDNALVLMPPDDGVSVAVIFSFLGADGNPFKPPKYDCEQMGVIDLPEAGLKKFSIGIAADHGNSEPNDLAIEFF